MPEASTSSAKPSFSAQWPCTQIARHLTKQRQGRYDTFQRSQPRTTLKCSGYILQEVFLSSSRLALDFCCAWYKSSCKTGLVPGSYCSRVLQLTVKALATHILRYCSHTHPTLDTVTRGTCMLVYSKSGARHCITFSQSHLPLVRYPSQHMRATAQLVFPVELPFRPALMGVAVGGSRFDGHKLRYVPASEIQNFPLY